MLTFILLVVLAGGVGLIAVSAAEHNDPATPSLRSRRGGHRRPARAPRADGPPRGREPRTEQAPAAPVAATPTATDRPGPAPRRHRGRVPARLTAVEGSFGVVALRSPSRRLVSLALIVALVVVVALVIAGAAGLAAAAIGRILDSAIG